MYDFKEKLKKKKCVIQNFDICIRPKEPLVRLCRIVEHF